MSKERKGKLDEDYHVNSLQFLHRNEIMKEVKRMNAEHFKIEGKKQQIYLFFIAIVKLMHIFKRVLWPQYHRYSQAYKAE